MRAFTGFRFRLLLAAIALSAATLAAADDSGAALPQEAVEAAPAADASDIPGYLAQAQSALASMRQSLTKGLDELRAAREKKDVVQMTCVNEQVTGMKGLVRVGEDGLMAIQEAQASGNASGAKAEANKINMSKRKMDDLVQAAVNCAGAEATESNSSSDMEIDANLAVTDPYYGDPSFFYDPSTSLIDADSGQLGQEDPPEARPPQGSDVLGDPTP